MTELQRRYKAAYDRTWEFMAAIGQILSEDFEEPDAGAEPTRYQVDALNGLAGSLSALIEGYAKQN